MDGVCFLIEELNLGRQSDVAEARGVQLSQRDCVGGQAIASTLGCDDWDVQTDL